MKKWCARCKHTRVTKCERENSWRELSVKKIGWWMVDELIIVFLTKGSRVSVANSVCDVGIDQSHTHTGRRGVTSWPDTAANRKPFPCLYQHLHHHHRYHCRLCHPNHTSGQSSSYLQSFMSKERQKSKKCSCQAWWLAPPIVVNTDHQLWGLLNYFSRYCEQMQQCVRQ